MQQGINFCPSCGAHCFKPKSLKEFFCTGCGYQYFHNTAAAVAAVITYQDKVLFAVRGCEPAKGLLDFPGGFIDPNESLETGLLRELQEELRWQPRHTPQYLFSGFNTYQYADVEYKTVDSFFHIECQTKPKFVIGDDVADVKWLNLSELKQEQLGFDVMREAVIKLKRILFVDKPSLR